MREKVAAVYAEAILKKIQSIPCPKEQKVELLRAVRGDLKNK